MHINTPHIHAFEMHPYSKLLTSKTVLKAFYVGKGENIDIKMFMTCKAHSLTVSTTNI